MNKIKVVTASQKEAAYAAKVEEVNLFLGNAVSALKNGVSVKRVAAQLEEKGLVILEDRRTEVLRVSFPEESTQNEVMFHFYAKSPRFYMIYLLEKGYNVEFNDWENL